MTAGAIQEQLGPKLEAKNRPVEILAIDHAEKPSASVARKLAPERNRNERDLILTAEDREEIKRLVAAMISESASLQHASEQLRDLIANQGFTELVFRNPSSGETTVLGASLESHPVVDVLARAIEVFGTREKALRWLRTPIRALGDRTPISLLHSPEGVASVQDTLGRIEHGVW